MVDSFPQGSSPKVRARPSVPAGVDAHAAAALALLEQAPLDPAELEQPAGDGRGQRAVQVPAALGGWVPIDAGTGDANPTILRRSSKHDGGVLVGPSLRERQDRLQF